MKLPLKTRPRALISTAMMLSPGLRQQLESHFGCPVLDVYSMNEAGPVAVLHDGIHVLLQHRLYVEILDPDGNPCPPGVRGEVTLTSGLNFFLLLLRYRTNDYAALEWRDGGSVLVALQGRPPTIYRGANGQLINTLDVTGRSKDSPAPVHPAPSRRWRTAHESSPRQRRCRSHPRRPLHPVRR